MEGQMKNIKIVDLLGNEVDFLSWKFPAGEVGTRIEMESLNLDTYIIIVEQNYDSDTIMKVIMLASTLSNQGKTVKVYFKYLPYSRQDRAVSSGEVASKEVLVNLMRAAGVSKIYTDDIHSGIGSCIVPIHSIPLTDDEVIKVFPNTETIVLPDEGAYEKYAHIFQDYNIVFGKKSRCKQTGKILSYKLLGKLKGEVTVVDDICDGGRTFIEVAKILGKTKKSNLYVTHGIFSNSIELLESYYDEVHFKNKVQHHV